MNLDDRLYNNEEKLKYIIKKLNLKTSDIAQKLEISAGLVSQVQNHYNGKLRKIHLYALSQLYNIPMEIFELESIDSKKKIDEILDRVFLEPLFKIDMGLLDKLVGRWYLYSYPSNTKLSKVWKTETHIYKDCRVLDVHKNRGELYMGKKQSIIIKESHNSKNFTITVFDNDRVTYGVFPFSRIAKSNSFNREILSFGFFSKREIAVEEAKEILGSMEEVQLQMNYSMLERVIGSIEMKG